MVKNSILESLFIGGTADGRRLPVNDCFEEYHLPSVANLPDGSEASDDADPRPNKVPVVEVYLPVAVKHDDGVETVFALNALTDEAVQVQVVKHFGSEASFRR